MEADYIVVGAGLTGATIARTLVDHGKSVIVAERRANIGGNVCDHVHSSGIIVHTYGPHYFRTNDEGIWRFVNRFGEFYRYEAKLKTLVDGQFERWPIAEEYIVSNVGPSWTPQFIGVPANFEETALSMMPKLVYEKFVKGYTEKQWGVSARSLSPILARRFDVRKDNDERLMKHEFQGIPLNGYSNWVRQMLDGIPCEARCDYLRNRGQLRARFKTIYTGPIDEYFDYDLGRLDYRGQKRSHEFFEGRDTILPCAQVNYPSPKNGKKIRTIEWKHIMQRAKATRIAGTLLTHETPYSPLDPEKYEYPFPDERNKMLYRQYAERASREPKLLLCGRLGEYRYYDMDQAIGRALLLARRLIDGSPSTNEVY